ncbi:hypothetical protein CROQUDRAFT_40872, partial [Cronartium quercuum f. sp. fusiforme G11]
DLCLQIQDFATVVEAEEAMQSGDVGHLMSVWKLWSLMAHGFRMVPQYALHPMWFMVLVEQDLPKQLARLITVSPEHQSAMC